MAKKEGRDYLEYRFLIKRILRRIYRLPQILLGISICKVPLFNHYKLYLLSTWRDSGKRSKIDNFLFPYVEQIWLRFEYLKESDPDRREELKSLAMGGVSGRNWAKEYDGEPLDFNSRIGHMTFQEACPIFDEIEKVLQNAKSNLVVIQIGSSSGREIAYFAAKFPKFEYMGTDIYKEVVSYSGQSHCLPNLSFKLSSAKNISEILSGYKGRDILVYSSGSLQYVQPEHLKDFFDIIASHADLKIVISEPASETHGEPDELKKSIWRGDFSYTHDYRYYTEKAGLETVKCKIIKPYFPYKDFPMRKNTVHYFYYGKSRATK